MAPLAVRVPPAAYGGTERVVSILTEELVRRGHEVTLFAAGGSQTSARLRAGSAAPLWEIDKPDQVGYAILQAEDVVEHSGEFDVIHSHVDSLLWPFVSRLAAPLVTTLHGSLELPLERALLRHFGGQPLVSISDSQRKPVRDLELNWIATIHHGLPPAAFPARGEGDGGYLLFLGRIAPEKGPVIAIRAAQRARIPLKIAARVGPEDRRYFEDAVAPLLSDPLVEWLGEVAEQEKIELLRHAVALLLPVQWDEPFGMVFIEALACGTPVISSRRGSLPELVRQGVNGFLVEGGDALVEACRAAGRLSRGACRESAADRFSAARMTGAYEAAYHQVIARARQPVLA